MSTDESRSRPFRFPQTLCSDWLPVRGLPPKRKGHSLQSRLIRFIWRSGRLCRDLTLFPSLCLLLEHERLTDEVSSFNLSCTSFVTSIPCSKPISWLVATSAKRLVRRTWRRQRFVLLQTTALPDDQRQRIYIGHILTWLVSYLQKTKTTMSGTQMQHAKESNADIMRQKQAAGMSEPYPKPQKRFLQATTKSFSLWTSEN